MRATALTCLAALALLPATIRAQTDKVANPNPHEEAEERVQTSLLVQAAMQQAKECLTRGEYQIAVRVLEAQLPKINGHAGYLALLEEAYRGYVQDLKKKGQEELAQKYLDRLAILDPGVRLPAAVKPAVRETAGPRMVVRGSSDEDKAGLTAARQMAREAVTNGDREFQARHYREAGGHYQKALQCDPNLAMAQTCRDRWAYCKLYLVAEQLNNPPQGGPDLTALETEVRTALALSPKLEFGQTLLQAITQRKGGAAPAGAVPHQAQRQGDWLVAESANFRVFHLDPQFGEPVAQAAEQARAAAARRWLGDDAPRPWPARCDVYVYPTAAAYSRATGVSGDSPGHSTIQAEKHDAARVLARRIDLRADDPHLLTAVLPHEATHVTLAGQFGAQPLPRWADEGLAILSEPAERVGRHLRGLPAAYQEGRVFTAGQLLPLEDYPAPSLLAAFYGQSVAMVRYLSDLKGPQTFTAFLRSAQREGYEGALRRHYGIRDLNDLDQQWRLSILSGAQLSAR